MLPSSSAMRLKLSVSSRNIGGEGMESRAEKSPAARRLIASITRRTGLSGNRLMTSDTTVPTMMLIRSRSANGTNGSCRETMARLSVPVCRRTTLTSTMMADVMSRMKNTMTEKRTDSANGWRGRRPSTRPGSYSEHAACQRLARPAARSSGEVRFMFFSPPCSRVRGRRRAQIPYRFRTAGAGG